METRDFELEHESEYRSNARREMAEKRSLAASLHRTVRAAPGGRSLIPLETQRIFAEAMANAWNDEENKGRTSTIVSDTKRMYTNKTHALNPDFGKKSTNDLNVFHQSAAELALGEIGEVVRRSRFGSPGGGGARDVRGDVRARKIEDADVAPGTGAASTPIRSLPRRLKALPAAFVEPFPASPAVAKSSLPVPAAAVSWRRRKGVGGEGDQIQLTPTSLQSGSHYCHSRRSHHCRPLPRCYPRRRRKRSNTKPNLHQRRDSL